MKIKTVSKRKIILFIAAVGVTSFLLITKMTLAKAQQPTNIPSDLALDLQLASQNPSPDQQAIVSSEISQAQLVTTTGQTNTTTPQDIVAPAAKTESAVVAIHPEETSSEQVVEQPVTIPIPTNTNNQPSPPSENTPTGTDNSVSPTSSPDNFVPGTTVTEPNDNAAPTDNSVNPNLPAPTSVDTPSDFTPTGQQQPTTAPSDTTQQSSQPASNDSGTSNTSGQSDNSGTSVQGVTTSPNRFVQFFHDLWHAITH